MLSSKNINAPLTRNVSPNALVTSNKVTDNKQTITDNKAKNYYGTCQEGFKGNYNNHAESFRNRIKEKST